MSMGMPARDAIIYIAEYFGINTHYGIAKALSDDTLNVQPIQIANYLKGRKMSTKVAQRVFDTFGIVISDTFRKAKQGILDVESKRTSRTISE